MTGSVTFRVWLALFSGSLRVFYQGRRCRVKRLLVGDTMSVEVDGWRRVILIYLKERDGIKVVDVVILYSDMEDGRGGEREEQRERRRG